MNEKFTKFSSDLSETTHHNCSLLFHFVHKDICRAKSMFAPLVETLADIHSRVLKIPLCHKQEDLEWELSKCFIYSKQLGRVRWLSGRWHRIRRFKSNNMDSIRSRHCKTYNPLVIKTHHIHSRSCSATELLKRKVIYQDKGAHHL